MINPPARLGILGSGQLGRMFTQRAQIMGYTVVAFSPDRNSPAGKAGALEFVADYEDINKLEEFIESVEAVSFEFENIPPRALEFLVDYEKNSRNNFFTPSPSIILIAQDRIQEKSHFKAIGLPTVQFLTIVTGEEDFLNFPFPAVLKTSRFGYDGKGQIKLNTREELRIYLDSNPPNKNLNYILEAYYPFDKEISVIYARDRNGKEFIFPPARNVHRNHILNTTEFPAQLTNTIHDAAISMASVLGRSLDYVGVFGIEYFVAGDNIVVNEFAPRPHNSGHYTQQGSLISQFDLQLRIMIGLSLPEENQIRPVIMKNLLGDDYLHSVELCLQLMEQDSRYGLNLYQKDEPRPGRKMGHINFLGTIKEMDRRIIEI